MDSVAVFIDTNAFIQLRDLKDLPWQELFPRVRHVAVMVARPVIAELDKHKVSTNARRRDRARVALRLIDEASAAPKRTVALRDEPIRVTLSVPPRARPDWKSLSELDSEDADDQLVAATLTFGNNAVLLSHDSGPRISARDVELTAYEPPESWHLPTEQSDDQRKIGKLERELKQALESKPRMEIGFPAADGEARMVLCRPRLPQLDRDIMSRLRDRYLALHPIKNVQAVVYPLGARHPLYAQLGITPESAEKYRDSYEVFREKVDSYFETLHEKVARVGGAPDLSFEIFNSGNASAEQLLVTLRLNGDLGILAGKDDLKAAVGSLILPNPPDPPKARNIDDLFDRHTTLLGVDSLARVQPRDPTEMRWLERPRFTGKLGTYGCDDFRPRRRYRDTLWLWPTVPLPVEGELTVTVSANHLADVSVTVHISIIEQEDKWLSEAVLELLPEFVRDGLVSMKK